MFAVPPQTPCGGVLCSRDSGSASSRGMRCRSFWSRAGQVYAPHNTAQNQRQCRGDLAWRARAEFSQFHVDQSAESGHISMRVSIRSGRDALGANGSEVEAARLSCPKPALRTAKQTPNLSEHPPERRQLTKIQWRSGWLRRSTRAMSCDARTLIAAHRRNSVSTVGDLMSRSSWEIYVRCRFAANASSSCVSPAAIRALRNSAPNMAGRLVAGGLGCR